MAYPATENYRDDDDDDVATTHDDATQMQKTAPVPSGTTYVEHTLAHAEPVPKLSWSNFRTELNWVNVVILLGLPVAALYGLLTTRLRWETAAFGVFYYFFTGLGITAGAQSDFSPPTSRNDGRR
jgi:stearoyl-CoA desaturase (delta-9 desaturase)